MTPTPEQLNNRKLLAQDVRLQLEQNEFTPTINGYMIGPPGNCAMCAVGSVVAAGARHTPGWVYGSRNAVSRFAKDQGLPYGTGGDWHTLLMHLLGFTLSEAAAFETAYMGEVIFVDKDAQKWANEQGLTQGWDLSESYQFFEQAVQDPLITSALDWHHAFRKTRGVLTTALEDRKARLHSLLYLLESWETSPVSFPSEVK